MEALCSRFRWIISSVECFAFASGMDSITQCLQSRALLTRRLVSVPCRLCIHSCAERSCRASCLDSKSISVLRKCSAAIREDFFSFSKYS